jgi:hypothetical protein
VVYCLSYGVNNTKAELHFFVPTEAASSKGSSHGLCKYPFDRGNGADTAILTDIPFKVTILIVKRILVEMCMRLIYKIRSLYV